MPMPEPAAPLIFSAKWLLRLKVTDEEPTITVEIDRG